MNKIMKVLSLAACFLIIPVVLLAAENRQPAEPAGIPQYNLHTADHRNHEENFPGKLNVSVLLSSNSLTPVEAEGEIQATSDTQTTGNDNAGIQVNQNEPVEEATDGTKNIINKPVADTKKPVAQPLKSDTTNTTKDAAIDTQNPANDLPVTTPTGKAPFNIETILTAVSNWWLSNPVSLQIWYLFFLVGLIFYLFKLRNLRRPLLFLSIIVIGFYLGNSLDPIGAIFNLLPRPVFTFDTALILTGIAVVLSLLFGRFYCGWICPLGAVQEFVHPKTNIIKISNASDKVLKNLKYIVLIIFLYLSWQTGNNLWNKYDPMRTLVHFQGASLALFILILLFIVSVIIERPFCRYICPLGAILSLTSRIAPFRMRSDANVCMVCGKCTSGECQMNSIEALNRAIDLPKIDSSECINCLDCQNICQRTALRVTAHRIDRVM